MTKDFEARAKRHEAFETEWKFQQGSLMLKNENEGKEWKRVVADHFFQLGARYGREAGLDLAAGIAEKRVRCQTNYDMCREAEIIAKAIRAAKEKK